MLRKGQRTKRGATVLHGMLVSELDEPTRIPAEFEALLDAYSLARERYIEGVYTQVEYAQALQQLRLTDANGTEWTLGADTGRWFMRLPGSMWEPAVPPAADSSTTYHSAADGVGAAAAGGDPLANLLSGGDRGSHTTEAAFNSVAVSEDSAVTGEGLSGGEVFFDADVAANAGVGDSGGDDVAVGDGDGLGWLEELGFET